MTELQQRLQMCENNWVRKIARVTRAYVQEKNGGVKPRDRSAEEHDRETGEDQTTVGGYVERWGKTYYRRERQSYESRAGGDEGDQG